MYCLSSVGTHSLIHLSPLLLSVANQYGTHLCCRDIALLYNMLPRFRQCVCVYYSNSSIIVRSLQIVNRLTCLTLLTARLLMMDAHILFQHKCITHAASLSEHNLHVATLCIYSHNQCASILPRQNSRVCVCLSLFTQLTNDYGFTSCVCTIKRGVAINGTSSQTAQNANTQLASHPLLHPTHITISR